MKRPQISVVIAFATVYVLLPCVVYILLVIKQGRDIELGFVKNEGVRLVNIIKNNAACDDPGCFEREKMNFANSTEYFSMLMKKQGDVAELFTHSSKMVRASPPGTAGLSSKNNIWTVVKNLPTNAPGHMVVLVSRNIDPASLRTRLGKTDMGKEISFDLEGETGLLRNYAILIRNDGNGLILRCGRNLFSASLRHRSYGYIYSGRPFDLSTSDIGGLRVTYMTPDGEVMPENR
jgi:hypothetical protein